MLSLVGIMVIFQTAFQNRAGIELFIEVTITKVGIFVLLAIVAIYYEIKLFKNIKQVYCIKYVIIGIYGKEVYNW